VGEQRSGSAADQVRAVLEAAEQVRAQAEAESERTRAGVSRIAERAEQLDRRLDELADAVTEAVAGLRAELESLRAEAEAEEPEPAAGGDDALIAEAEAAAARKPEVTAPAAEDVPAPDAPEAPDAQEAPDAPDASDAPEAPAPEGARLLALKMALDGRSREDTAAYLRENFELDDPSALLDEVYAQAGS
jgi:hypothetical protein